MHDKDHPFSIEVTNLSKEYRDLVALNNISFSIGSSSEQSQDIHEDTAASSRGRIVGLLGPNGAGKTTLMRILTGAMPATRGVARVAGFDVAEYPMEVKKRVGYLPEIPPVYGELTVHEYLAFVGELKGLKGQRLKDDIERVVNRVSIVQVCERLIGNLSKGYQQRTGIAQALLGNPEVLILDEPTVGLDPRQIGEIRHLIADLAREGEHTVILSSHILQEITATCSRVLIMNKGNLVADETLDDLVKKHHRQGKAASLEEIFLSLTEF